MIIHRRKGIDVGKRTLFCLFVFSLMTSGCFAEQAPTQNTGNLSGSYVMVYYFHGDIRCASCHRIETYTKEAVDEQFGKELSSGKLVFQVVNIEKSPNQHFVKDYQLYTRSVVLSLVKDGKEVEYKNLTDVWNHLRDKPRFFSYIKDEVNKYLKRLE